MIVLGTEPLPALLTARDAPMRLFSTLSLVGTSGLNIMEFPTLFIK
jgi:hypothetical protein